MLRSPCFTSASLVHSHTACKQEYVQVVPSRSFTKSSNRLKRNKYSFQRNYTVNKFGIRCDKDADVLSTQASDAATCEEGGKIYRRQVLSGGAIVAGSLPLVADQANATEYPKGISFKKKEKEPEVISTPIPENLSDFTLSNGIRFIVLERSQAPIVSFHTTADVGAINEVEGATGLAHFLEHMAFKGTQQIGTKDFYEESKYLDACDEEFYALKAAQAAGDQRAAQGHKQELLAQQQKAALWQRRNAYGALLSQEGGIGLNASTSHDSTQYFVSLPANKLELWMAVESSRWRAPVFRELYAEKEVIKEERRLRVDNSRLGRFTEKFLQQAFAAPDPEPSEGQEGQEAPVLRGSPYGRPVIGTEEDFQGLGRREVEKFFLQNYQPGALTMAIVGDVKTEKVKSLAEKYFGPWTGSSLAVKNEVYGQEWEPPTSGPRELRMELPAGPYLMQGYYRPPGSDTKDDIILGVISDLLSGGRSCRLYKNLVLKGSALYCTCYDTYPQNKLTTLFVLAGVPAPGRSTDDLSADFQAQLDALIKTPVSKSELMRVKKKTRAALIEVQSSTSSMASLLCDYQLKYGDYKSLFDYPAQVEAITSKDIQRVAKQIFQPSNRFSGHVTAPVPSTRSA